ncbi:MAG: hypothetical protein V3R99_08040 [Thermoguttaceae bacterium]
MSSKDTAARPEHGPPVQPVGSRSDRVRELPPPPKSSPGLSGPLETPDIRADESMSGTPGGWRAYFGRRQSSSCLASFALHFALLLVLGMLVQASLPEPTIRQLIASFETSEPLPDMGQYNSDVFRMRPGAIALDVPNIAPSVLPKVAHPNERAPGSSNDPEASAGMKARRPIDRMQQSDASLDGALDGRSGEARAGLVADGGGSPGSELAVERGLRWLMAHQRYGGAHDGSWDFDHHKSICRGQCADPGTEGSSTGATAIVLLPFLGAGHTHLEGEYRDTVRRGLYYLTQRALATTNGVDLQEGTMYAQGLATIALCEAYAMTGDPTLRDVAQGAIDFVLYAQDRKGGGWRYTPGEPGDTTVSGWQLMGLKSGQMARLMIPSPNIEMVRHFLDSVQSDNGARYGYLDPQPRQTTTAIGLLCRMYTGWPHDHPALGRGVGLLDEWGPSDDNIYFNYYATQVMHHYGGPKWERWNLAMREHLIATQASNGHEAGSWFFSGGYGDRGGRLYNTAMAVMTLEVYYRHMRLYREKAVKGSF